MGARRRRDELAATDAELMKTEAALERYMRAFENGAVSVDMFGERVHELGRKAHALRARRAELATAVGAHGAPVPSPEDLEELRVQLIDIAEHGPEPVRKAVAQAFVHGLVVEARDRVQPTFRIPSGLTVRGGSGDGAELGAHGGVRAITPEVDLRGVEPLTSALPTPSAPAGDLRQRSGMGSEQPFHAIRSDRARALPCSSCQMSDR